MTTATLLGEGGHRKNYHQHDPHAYCQTFCSLHGFLLKSVLPNVNVRSCTRGSKRSPDRTGTLPKTDRTCPSFPLRLPPTWNPRSTGNRQRYRHPDRQCAIHLNLAARTKSGYRRERMRDALLESNTPSPCPNKFDIEGLPLHRLKVGSLQPVGCRVVAQLVG